MILSTSDEVVFVYLLIDTLYRLIILSFISRPRLILSAVYT